MIRVYSLVFDGCFPNISIKRVVDLFKCLYTHVDFPYLSLRKDTLKQFLSLLLQPLLEDLYLKGQFSWVFNRYLILATLPLKCWIWKQRQAFEKLTRLTGCEEGPFFYPINIIHSSTPFSGWPKKAWDAFSIPKCLGEKAHVTCRGKQSCSVLRNWGHSSASVWFARESLLGTLRSNNAKATRTSLKNWICVNSSSLYGDYSYLLCQMYANPPEFKFQGTIFNFKKRNKIRRCLYTFSIKHEIRHLNVVVVQNGKEM